MIDMGHEAEAKRRIRQTIARATRLDSTMTLYDLQGKGRAGARELRGGGLAGIFTLAGAAVAMALSGRDASSLITGNSIYNPVWLVKTR